MKLLTLAKLYTLTLSLLCCIDIPWILVIASSFYRSQIGHLMTDNPVWWAGALFYCLYTVGLLMFVIIPAVEVESISSALLAGFMFGLIVYSAYDLTNLATLKNWSLTMTAVDMAWGATASATVSGLSVFLSKYL
jgi:uncharacterized membrane protein